MEVRPATAPRLSRDRAPAVPDIESLAAEAVASTETSDGARQWLVAAAHRNAAVAEALIVMGANAAVCGTFSAARRRSVANPDRAIRGNDAGLDAVNRTSLLGLMAWPLPGLQKPLGEATREELAESLRYCRRMSGAYDLNARFIGFVHKLATDDKKPIRRQLTPEQVRSCRERAEKAAA